MKIIQMLLLLGLMIVDVQAADPDQEGQLGGEFRRRRVQQIQPADAAPENWGPEHKGDRLQIEGQEGLPQQEGKRNDIIDDGEPGLARQFLQQEGVPAIAGGPRAPRAARIQVEGASFVPHMLITATRAFTLGMTRYFVKDLSQSPFRPRNYAAFSLSLLEISSWSHCAYATCRQVGQWFHLKPPREEALFVNRCQNMLYGLTEIFAANSIIVLGWGAAPITAGLTSIVGIGIGLPLIIQGYKRFNHAYNGRYTHSKQGWLARQGRGLTYLASAYFLLTLHEGALINLSKEAQADTGGAQFLWQSMSDRYRPLDKIHLDHMYGINAFDLARPNDTIPYLLWKQGLQYGRRLLLSLSFYEIAGGTKDLFLDMFGLRRTANKASNWFFGQCKSAWEYCWISAM